MPKLVLLIIAIVWGGWLFYEPSIEHGPGVMAPSKPIQVKPTDPASFSFRGYKIDPLADFSVHARVLSRQAYTTGRESDLSPLDLALGWGRMSDSSVLAPFRFTQSGRWYHYKTSTWTVPKVEVTRFSANMHLIPSTQATEDALNQIIVGDVIRITGSLVNVESKDGWTWKSSTTRNDAGAGSCEIIWVTEVEIE